MLLHYCDARYLQRGALLSKTEMHAGTFTESIRHSRSFSESIGNGPKTTIVTSTITSANDFFRIMFAGKIRPLMRRIIDVFFITIAAGCFVIIVVIIMKCSLFRIIDAWWTMMGQRWTGILLKRGRKGNGRIEGGRTNLIMVIFRCFFDRLCYFSRSCTSDQNEENEIKLKESEIRCSHHRCCSSVFWNS